MSTAAAVSSQAGPWTSRSRSSTMTWAFVYEVSVRGFVRSRLSFANVVSCLALFVALGGTAMAAVVVSDNGQICAKHDLRVECAHPQERRRGERFAGDLGSGSGGGDERQAGRCRGGRRETGARQRGDG